MNLKDKANRITFGRGEAPQAAAQPAKAEESRTKTAPGAMMAYANDRRSELIKENDELKAKADSIDRIQARLDDTLAELRQWDGATVTKLIDAKLIVASQYANRDERSFSDASFQELKADIQTGGGNVQAIKVRPQKDAGKFEIVFGHRRHRACLELGLPVLAVIENLDDRALFAEMDRENRNRKDLRPYEQGVMYARALDVGLFPSLRKMSDALGVDPGNASKAISLARLPAQVLSAFSSPLDMQQAWASVLTIALQKDQESVLSRAATLAKMEPRPVAVVVFKELIGQGVVSNNTTVFKPISIKGKAGRVGKIGFNPKRKIFEISLAGLDANEINSVESAIKALVLGSPKASK